MTFPGLPPKFHFCLKRAIWIMDASCAINLSGLKKVFFITKEIHPLFFPFLKIEKKHQ
jgi:hypothetical protein